MFASPLQHLTNCPPTSSSPTRTSRRASYLQVRSADFLYILTRKFRTWRLNADGTRTLISTDEHGVEIDGADVMHISGAGTGSNGNDALMVGISSNDY